MSRKIETMLEILTLRVDQLQEQHRLAHRKELGPQDDGDIHGNQYIRLMFCEDENGRRGKFISKFLSTIIPSIGQKWTIPAGTHKYGGKRTKVRIKDVHVKFFSMTHSLDVLVLCDLLDD